MPGVAKGFRIGWPEYMDAWRVLDFEYSELDNEHILDDLSDLEASLRAMGF